MRDALSNLQGSIPDGCSFAIVPFAGVGPGLLDEALIMADRALLRAHVCIAVGARDIRTDRTALRTFNRAGLMLDVDDEDVPFSAFSSESVEAIRFRTSFARRAVSSIRSACVLDAMIGLARHLGLATLGPSLEGRGGLLCPDPEFDYIAIEDVAGPLSAALTPSGNATAFPAR